jgi:predicted RecB family nuclease
VDLTAGDAPVLDERDSYVDEARRAIEHGLAGNVEPLQPPWLRGECKRCDWHDWCMTELVALDDPTLLRGIDADLREDLARDGITTIAAVAAMDPGDERIGEGAVVLQARARTAGGLLRADRSGGAMDLPSAPVEVDFDIETHRGTTYLGGLLITEDGRSRYEPVIDWRGTDEGERTVLAALFDRFAEWSGDDVVVYHWTDYEPRTLGEAAARYGLTVPGSPSVEAWFDDHAVDLCEWCRQHLVSPNGFSLKTIAPLCGFEWRDDDPGGLQSEIWFERLRDGDEDMAQRLLAYNEDDVIAQMAVRRWIRRQDDGRGPGSAIASALEWGSDPPS